MKKAILLLTLSMGLSFASYANNSTNPVKPVNEKATSVVTTEKSTQQKTAAYGDFAVYCRIYDSNGKLIKECWLCDCPAPKPKQKL
ncbi:hypothetical protein [Rhodoflexus sp.]